MHTVDETLFYPGGAEVEKIVAADRGARIDEKIKTAIELLRESGHGDMAEKLLAGSLPLPEGNRSYHYLPYRFDSGFERTVFRELVSLKPVKDLGLEVYYNGDRALTEFQIRCYRGTTGDRQYIGMYTPDFLITDRRDGRFYRILIVETKGGAYAGQRDFLERRAFMEEFTRCNNEAFGYGRFRYLYVEDSPEAGARQSAMVEAISDFFGEEA